MRDKVKATFAVIIGCVVVLGCLEFGVRVVDYGNPIHGIDPFEGFEGTGQLFEKKITDKGSAVYVATPSKPELDQIFSVDKAPNTFRIFSFGASTTRGVPWGTNGSFSRWLQDDLQARYPDFSIEVINAGISGYGSSRVLQVMREMVEYQPDLLVVYTGQNEFRDAAFHADKLRRSRAEIELWKAIFKSRLVHVLHNRGLMLREKLIGPKPDSYASAEIASILSAPFSPKTFQSYDYYQVPDLQDAKDASPEVKWLRSLKALIGQRALTEQEVYDLFERNVREMIKLAMSKQIPIVFLVKVQNPKAVNALEHAVIRQDSLKDGSIERWRELFAQGVEQAKVGRCDKAVQALEQANDLYREDSEQEQRSLLHLYLGECYERLGLYEAARGEYSKRLSRQHRNLNSILRRVAAESKVATIDVEKVFEEHALHGIVGYQNFFVDNAHMTILGYQLLARSLADLIARTGYVAGRYAEGTTLQSSSTNMLDQFGSSNAYTSLGWSKFHQGSIGESVEYGRRALSIDQRAIQAHLLLGYAYTRMGELNEARREYDAISQLRSQRKYVW